jgi:hypothetical protein
MATVDSHENGNFEENPLIETFSMYDLEIFTQLGLLKLHFTENI